MPRARVVAPLWPIGAALVACALVPATAFPQSANYSAAVEQYRRGEHDAAIAALDALPGSEVNQSVRSVRAAARGSARDRAAVPRRFVEGALVLHTHAAALETWARTRNAHEQASAQLLDALLDGAAPPDLAFLRCWYLFSVSFDQGHGRLRSARRTIDSAPAPVLAHPDMALAIGALHETGWMLRREGEDVGFTPDLRAAAREYRRALAAAPASDEAQVRLGRVLTLLDDLDAAATALTAVRPAAEPSYRYLARLFEGDLWERRGELSRARERYEAAIAVLPRAQSARVALARLQHETGARRDAAATVRGGAAPDEPEGADPWLWYGKGIAWRTEGYLAAMQALVKP